MEIEKYIKQKKIIIKIVFNDLYKYHINNILLVRTTAPWMDNFTKCKHCNDNV